MAIKRTRESEEMYLETTLLLHKGSRTCAPQMSETNSVSPNRAFRAASIYLKRKDIYSTKTLFSIVLSVRNLQKLKINTNIVH